jgi:hypothetical protein
MRERRRLDGPIDYYCDYCPRQRLCQDPTLTCNACQRNLCPDHYNKWSDTCIYHVPSGCGRCGTDYGNYEILACHSAAAAAGFECQRPACRKDGCGKQGNALFFCDQHLRACIVCDQSLSPLPVGLWPSKRAPYGCVDIFVCAEDAELVIRLFVSVQRQLGGVYIPRDVKRLILQWVAAAEAPPKNRRRKRQRS